MDVTAKYELIGLTIRRSFSALTTASRGKNSVYCGMERGGADAMRQWFIFVL